MNINLDNLGPRQRKNLETCQIIYHRFLESYVQVYRDGTTMMLWCPFGGSPMTKEAREAYEAMQQKWSEDVAQLKAEHGDPTAKNRSKWENYLTDYTLPAIQELLPKVQQ